MNTNHTSNVLGHLLMREQADSEAWKQETEKLKKMIADAQRRTHNMLQWNRELINQSLVDGERIRRMQEGCRIVMDRLDDMYNLYTSMVITAPDISRYHDELQGIVLRAEVGRAFMVQEVIDLTGDETEEDSDDEGVEL